MNKEIKTHKSLGESVDELRNDLLGLCNDIDELYGLDDDNYKRINAVRSRLDAIEKRVRQNRAKTVFGFIGFAMLLYLLTKAWSKLEQRVDAIEKENAKPEESDESDG